MSIMARGGPFTQDDGRSGIGAILSGVIGRNLVFHVNDAGDAAHLEATSPSWISILGGVFESTHPGHIGPLEF